MRLWRRSGPFRSLAMKLTIDSTRFGQIKIEGEVFENDVIIRLDGEVKKRKKKLSKAIYGTSHVISLDEAKYIYEEGAEGLIIGSGQSGMVKLSEEAAAYFQARNCRVQLLPTPQAIRLWNQSQGAILGLFHVTC
jgi:hypothetical protein